MREEATISSPCSPLSTTVSELLVYRALNLGDMLCAVPALRALRAGLPRARITLLGLPWARKFAVRFRKYIDEFVQFPGYPGLPELQPDMAIVRPFLNDMRSHAYDLAIQMHGSGTITNGLIASLGAHRTAGFFSPGQNPPDPDLYVPYPENISEVERNLFLVRHLGFRPLGDQLEFPIMGDDSRDLSHSPELRRLRPGTYVCIHPGARTREKCWHVENFALVGRAIRQFGLTVVITGNRQESDLANRISAMMEGDCIDAASLDLSLGSLALLIRDARLLLCNDTGVSHLASALAVPSVVVFTSTDPGRWAPLERLRHRPVGGNGAMPSVQDVMQELHMILAERRRE